MTDNPTRVAGTTIMIGDDPDAIELDARNGNLTIVLATGISLVLNFADRDTIEKLAVVASEAAVVKRRRDLWQVA